MIRPGFVAWRRCNFMGARRALAILIALTTLARLAVAALIGPGNDEAYHWLYAVHLDWSYYDHPPMLAWVERLGMAGFGVDSWIGPRFGFVMLSAGSAWLLARIASRAYGDWAGFWAALALNAAPYYGLAAGTFALPDGPLLFFWLLTIDRLIVALDGNSTARWLGVGLAWGGAMLSKYHAAILPAGALLAIVWHAPWRVWLRRPGPYLAILLGFLVFSPVIFWNYRHGWGSFRFQGGRAVGSWQPRIDLLLRAVGGPALYLAPWIWLASMIVLVRAWRNAREATGLEKLSMVLATLPIGLVTLVGLFRPVLPHWSLIGVVSILPLLGNDWAQRWARNPRRMRRNAVLAMSVPVFLGILLVGQYRQGWLQRGAPGRIGLLPASADPTAESFGWDQVADRLRSRGWLNDQTFVFAGRWYHSGHLARVLGESTPVLCYNEGDARGFASWTEPEPWVGRTGLLITPGENPVEPACYARWFRSLEPLDDFWIERAGGKLTHIRITRCIDQKKPFPFRPRKPAASESPR